MALDLAASQQGLVPVTGMRFDSLRPIAERTLGDGDGWTEIAYEGLGDGTAYEEIFEVNEGSTQPMTSP